MPKLDIAAKAAALERRIEQLKNNIEVDARDINLLLEKHHKDYFDELWEQQKVLKKSKLPNELKSYENLYKQSAALVGKCRIVEETQKNTVNQNSFQRKALQSIKSAHDCLVSILASDSKLYVWLDRDPIAVISDAILDRFIESNKKINFINDQLEYLLQQLPVLVTSKSINRKVSQEERFNWQTKREIWIVVCEQALSEYKGNSLEYFEKKLIEKEVYAAKLFLDEAFKAKYEYRDPIAAGNKILTQRGFKHRTLDEVEKRNDEVDELEAKLIKNFESQMTDYEKQQKELWKEHEENSAKQRKKRSRS